MKKILFTLTALLIAFSVQAAEIKIGYVDIRKAVIESDEGKAALKALESMSTAKKTIIEEKAKVIRQKDEELAKQKSILTPEAADERKAEIEKLMAEYRQMIKHSEGEMQKSEAELVQKIMLDLKKLLSIIAGEEGYTAILDAPAVLYMPDELNLTDMVIRRFNEVSKKVEDKK
jgi:outer membrane protein